MARMMEAEQIAQQPRQKQPDHPVRAGQGVEHVNGRRGDHSPSLGSRAAGGIVLRVVQTCDFQLTSSRECGIYLNKINPSKLEKISGDARF